MLSERLLFPIAWTIFMWLTGGLGYYLTFKYYDKLNKKLFNIVFFFSAVTTLLWLGYNFGICEMFSITWTVKIRAIRGIELTTFFIGILSAIIQILANKRKPPKDKFSKHNGIVLMMLMILPIYIQPILFPYNDKDFEENWNTEVCQQSNDYSCGPSATATLLQHYGIHKTEKETASNIYLSKKGTELWHIARYLRKNGLKVSIHKVSHTPSNIPTPCVACVGLGGKDGITHVIVIFKETKDTFIIADPLSATRFEWDKEKTYANYYFIGTVIQAVK